MALRCLALLFAPMKTRLPESVPFVLIVPVSMCPLVLCYFSVMLLINFSVARHLLRQWKKKITNLTLLLNDEEDGATQYFVAVEQQLMIETTNLMAAIFFCIGGHYVIFNLSYHPKCSDVWVCTREGFGNPIESRGEASF